MEEYIKQESNKDPQRSSPPKTIDHFFVNTYTMLKILDQMRKELGLEAMLEYLQIYLRTMEEDNPKVHLAVMQALKVNNVAQIYKEASTCRRKGYLSG